MALGLSQTKTRFRFDSPIAPEITATGITNVGQLMIAKDLYVTVVNSTPYTYNPPNQSENKTIQLRNVARPTWTLGTNVALDSSDPKKSTANSDSGANVASLNATNCAIEGKTTAVNLLCGISLQTGTVTYSKDDASAEHCLIFQDDGYCAVYENGVRFDYTLTEYAIGDVGVIDKQGSIIRYYLIQSGVMKLLRTTRSKLTDADIKGVVILYHINAKLSEAYIYANESISSSIETIGVLENFQNWENDYSIVSTAEILQMQDGNPNFTFSNSKKRLRSLNASRLLTKTDLGLGKRLDYIDFFNFHGIEKEFIFIDRARLDVNDEVEWFWARFASPFGDKMRSQCLSVDNAQIIETFRKDKIILEFVDTEAPTAPGTPSTVSKTHNSITVDFDPSTDNVAVTGYQRRVDGGAWANISHTVVSGKIRVVVTGLSPTTEYDVEFRAYDGTPNYSALSSVLTETTNAAPLVNYAAAANGGTVAALLSGGSGTLSAVIDGLQHTNNGSFSSYAYLKAEPASLEFTFAASQTITKISVVGLKNPTSYNTDPDLSETTPFALKDYEGFYWTGSAWTSLFTVTGNDKVKTEHTVSITTTKLKLDITDTADGNVYLVEFMAQGT